MLRLEIGRGVKKRSGIRKNNRNDAGVTAAGLALSPSDELIHLKNGIRRNILLQ